MTPQRLEKLRSVLDRRQPDLTVITDYVHKGRNLSAIVRTADAVGVMDIHCVVGEKDYQYYCGTSMGSHSWVKARHYHSIVEPLSLLKQQGFTIVVANLSPNAIDFHEVDYTQPTALLLGSEKFGVSADACALADIHVTIPMAGMVESLNVSVAAGIILNEAQYQRQQKSMYDEQRLDQATYDRLFFEWAHPKISSYCKEHQLDFPPLADDGEIDNLSAWYAGVREAAAVVASK